ncbi:MAG TPA: hypothetical protein VK439_16485, partial [Rubrivivax sp.]|nr:hypothetical protein [Rubrivivax sp.]
MTPVPSPPGSPDADPFGAPAQVLARALRQHRLTVLVGTPREAGNRLTLDALVAQLGRRAGDSARKGGATPPAVVPAVERRRPAAGRGQRESVHVVTEWTEETLRGLFEQLDLRALQQRQLAGRVLFVFNDVHVPLEARLQRFAESWTAALRASHLDVGFLAAGDASIWPTLRALRGQAPAWPMKGFRLLGDAESPRLEPLLGDEPGQRHADDFTTSIEASVRHAAQFARKAESESTRFEDLLESIVLRVSQAAQAEETPSPQAADSVNTTAPTPPAQPAGPVSPGTDEEAARIEAETATRAAAEAARRATAEAEQERARAALQSALDSAASERQRADALASALAAAESADASAAKQARADLDAWRERAAAEWRAKAAEAQEKQRHLEQAVAHSQAERDSARNEVQALQDRVAALELAAEAARGRADTDLQRWRESAESQWRDEAAKLQAQVQQFERSLAEAQAARDAAQASVAQLHGRLAELESTVPANVAAAVDAERARASSELAAWRERAEAEQSARMAQALGEAQAQQRQLQQALAGAEAARDGAHAEVRSMQGHMQRLEADAKQAREQAAALRSQQQQLEQGLTEAQTSRQTAQAEAQQADRRLVALEAAIEAARVRADAPAKAEPPKRPPPGLPAAAAAQADQLPPELPAAEVPQLHQPPPLPLPPEPPPPAQPAVAAPQSQGRQPLQLDERPTEAHAAEAPRPAEAPAPQAIARPGRRRRSLLLWSGGAVAATIVAALLWWPGRQGADVPRDSTPSVAMAPQTPAAPTATAPAAAPAAQPATQPAAESTVAAAPEPASAAAQAPAPEPAASAVPPAPPSAPPAASAAAVAAETPSWPNRLELVAAGDGGSHERITRELAQALSGVVPVTVVAPARGDTTLSSLGTAGRLAIVRHDALRAARASGGPSVRVLAPLFKEEVLFIVRADSKLKAIHELGGKRIALGSDGGPLVRDALQRIVDARLVRPAVGRDRLLAELVAFRTIDAIVVVDPQPSAWWNGLPAATARRLRLLTLEAANASDRRLLQAFGTSVNPSNAGATGKQRTTTPAVTSYLVASADGGPDADGALQLTRQLCDALPQLRRNGH